MVPVLLLADVSDAGRSQAWLVTLGLTVWAGFRLSLLLARGEATLFALFFWLYVYVFLGLGATVQIRADAVAGTTPDMDPALDLPTALVVVLGVVAWEVGHAAAGRLGPGPRPRLLPEREAPVSALRVLVLLAVGVLFVAYVVVLTGPAVTLGTREEANAVREAAWPDLAIRSIVEALSLVPLLIAIGGLAELRRRTSSPGVRRLCTTGAVLGGVLLLAVVGPSTARYTIATVVFAIAVLAGAVRTRTRVRRTVVATLFGFLFIFPIADAFRRADSVDASRQGFFDEYVGNSDYDSFWQVANALSYWRDGLVEPMRQLAGSVLFWVPRGLWPEKPLDTGVTLAQYRDYDVDNLSAPLWAEALANGGLVAVVIFLFVAGFAVGRLDDRVVRGLRVGGTWVLVAAVFPVYSTILLRGSLLQATGTLAVAVACVVFVRARGRVVRPAGQAP
jgi:hypothetical protein